MHFSRVPLLLAALSGVLQAGAFAQAGETDSGWDRGWHTVRPKESLGRIARQYLGTAESWQEIWELNPDVPDPDGVQPGQRLRVRVDHRVARAARISALAGQVEMRAAPIPWNPARELDLVLEEDGLRTGTRASCEVAYHDGPTLKLTEDSLVYIRRWAAVLAEPSRVVEIVEGQGELRITSPPPADFEILVGGARISPRQSSDSLTRVRGTDYGGKLMAYEGRAVLSWLGEPTLVPEAMGTVWGLGPPGVPPVPEKLLPAPDGLRPSSGTQLTFNNVELAWEPVEGAASYTAELCGDAECARLVERRVGLTGVTWRLETPLGEYFWRVTAVSPGGLDGYPSPGAQLAVLGGPDHAGPTGSLSLHGRQLRFGDRLVVDESVRVELLLEDHQSGVAGWRPIIDGVEVSRDRWRGPWLDGTYQLAVRATDQAGNVSVIPADAEIVVDTLPPVITATGHRAALAGQQDRDHSRCGWLRKTGGRWASVTQCGWVRKAQRRWVRQGWPWLEVSVDGRRWRPLIEEGSEPAREVARAGYRLPAEPATMTVRGGGSPLLVRSADGAPLLHPGGATAGPVLRIRAQDAGAGVDCLEVRVIEAENGVLSLSVEATDALGHSDSLEWAATSR